MESAMLISAWGRSVSVGLSEEEDGGVMDVRKTGHSIMARERDLSRRGRNVRRV